MKNCKAAGTRRENQVKKLMESEGWTVLRAPASIGEADLIAMKAGERNRLVQVKSNKDGGPYKSFGPKARAALRDAARSAGAVAELVWWPPRGECRWYDEAVWP